MKAHTSEYKENIKLFGRELDSKITYTLNGQIMELGNEDLNSVEPHYESAILKSVMKQLDIDSNINIPLNTNVNFKHGVKTRSGKNLLKNTSEIDEWSEWFTPNYNANNISTYLYTNNNMQHFINGQKFTLSFDVQFENVTATSGQEKNWFPQIVINETDVNTWNGKWFSFQNSKTEYTTLENGTYHFEEHFTLDNDYTNYLRYIFVPRVNWWASGRWRIKNVQLEIGDNATTYEKFDSSNFDYINFGNYIVYSSEKQEDTNSYKITCYDKMLYSMKDYVKLNITYPITIRNYISAICNYLGLTFKNANDTFANYNRMITSEKYLTTSDETLGYKFRDVFDELAQVTASTICINEEDDELEIRYINETEGKNLINLKTMTYLSKSNDITNYEILSTNSIKTQNTNQGTYNSVWFSIDNLSSGTYTLSAIAEDNSNTTGNVGIGIESYPIGSNDRDAFHECWFHPIERSQGTRISNTFQINTSTHYYKLRIFSNQNVINSNTTIISDIMLEKNSTMSDYVPAGDTIDEEFLKDINVNFGEQYGPIKTIVLSRANGADNIYYPYALPNFKSLPSEYTPVEYIESTGTQYIDTGVIGNNNLGFEIDFLTFSNIGTGAGNFGSIFGSRTSYNTNGYQLTTYNDTNLDEHFLFGTNSTVANIRYNAGIIPQIRQQINFKNLILTLPNGTTKQVTNYNFTTPSTIALFAKKENNGVGEYSKTRIYNLKFYDSNNLIRDFIPCYRNSDNVIGLYDLVNNVFYTNQGTGTFNKGVEIKSTSEIKIIDNQIMNGNDRSDYMPDIYNKLNGLQYYINNYSSTGITYYDLCDKYNIKIGDKIYPCIMFNDDINVNRGLEENVFTDLIEQSETNYSKSDKTDRKVNQAYVIADKANETVEAMVNNIGQNGEVTAASIKLAINNDTSNITIDADNININGVVSANGKFKIDTRGNMEATGGSIGDWTIFNEALSADKEINSNLIIQTTLRPYLDGTGKVFVLGEFYPFGQGEGNYDVNYKDYFYIDDNGNVLCKKLTCEELEYGEILYEDSTGSASPTLTKTLTNFKKIDVEIRDINNNTYETKTIYSPYNKKWVYSKTEVDSNTEEYHLYENIYLNTGPSIVIQKSHSMSYDGMTEYYSSDNNFRITKVVGYM